MKKYRCLWCLSTKNHNILYFVHIRGIYFPNKGKCLWKARSPLRGAGFRGQLCPKSGATAKIRGGIPLKSKPSPRRERGQEAEMVQIQRQICADVEILGRIFAGEIQFSKCDLIGSVCCYRMRTISNLPESGM